MRFATTLTASVFVVTIARSHKVLPRRRDIVVPGLLTGGGFVIGLSTGLKGCAPTTRPPDSPTVAFDAVCTVAMIGDIVRQIGGSRVNITTLMGSGVDPHLYKATSDDFRVLGTAQLTFAVGLLLEGRLQQSLQKLSQSRQIIFVADQIPKDRLLGDAATESSAAQAHPDPHVWLDIELWAEIVAPITAALSKQLPEFSSEFTAASQKLLEELRRLHAYGKQVIGSIPEASRVLVTSHDAFQYFGRAYGLQVLGVQGISTESEAGLLRVNQLVDLLVKQKISAVFVESSVPRKSIAALIEGAASRGHSVRIGGSLFSDAMGADGTWEGTYQGMLDHNLTTVALALGGSAPQKGFKGRLTAPTEADF